MLCTSSVWGSTGLNFLYRCSLCIHFFENIMSCNDTQCYVPLHPKDVSSIQCLLDCLRGVTHWMSANFLQLNGAKTELLTFGLSASTEMVASKLSVIWELSYTWKKCRCYFWFCFYFWWQFNSVVRSCFHQLKNIATIKSFLSKDICNTCFHQDWTIEIYCIWAFHNLYCNVSSWM